MNNQHPCQLICDILPDYFAETLPDDQQSFVKAHLATCPTCRGESQQWELLTSAMHYDAARIVPQISQDMAWQSLRQLVMPEAPLVVYHVAKQTNWWSRIVSRTINIANIEFHIHRQIIWISNAMLFAITIVLLLLSPGIPDPLVPIALLSGPVAFVSIALILSQHADGLSEIVSTTPYPVWQLLIIRLGIILVPQLALNTMVSIVLIMLGRTPSFSSIIGVWFAPTLFATALTATLVSLTSVVVALGTIVLLWGVRILTYSIPHAPAILVSYQEVWLSSTVLSITAMLLFLFVIFTAPLRTQRP